MKIIKSKQYIFYIIDAKNTIDQQFKPSIMFRVSSIMCNFRG